MKIFFSWQSDVGKNVNTKQIRKAIDNAIKNIKETSLLMLERDEATLNEPGAPNIPQTIANKIRECDIFIADITTVLVKNDQSKSFPNPNVTFEIGLAAAYIGWGRIILLFNEGIANFSGIPFDFDRQRISTYKIKDNGIVCQIETKNFCHLIKLAISTIIEKNPLKPHEIDGKSEEEIKKIRDTRQIEWFFRHIDVGLFGKCLNEIPNMMSRATLEFAQSIEYVTKSSDFHLYNEKLYDLFQKLSIELSHLISFKDFYPDLLNNYRSHIDQKFVPQNGECFHKIEDKIAKSRDRLRNYFDEILKIIRMYYVIIDLSETSSDFISSLDYGYGIDEVTRNGMLRDIHNI